MDLISKILILKALNRAIDTLRAALAMGADTGVHIKTDLKIDSQLQPLAVAKILAKIQQEHKYDLILLGKQSIDGDYNQTGQILSSILFKSVLLQILFFGMYRCINITPDLGNASSLVGIIEFRITEKGK